LELSRGEIYFIFFPYTFDPKYPAGKKKFVLVLQEGAIFKDYDAVTVLLTTTDQDSKNYDTNITIEKGTTKLSEESYVICAQPYTILKSLFEKNEVWCAGKLSSQKMDEIDEALYIGLCMGLQNDCSVEETSRYGDSLSLKV
jgi:mRNA-degrading endonuclease toxin of MazEF toxin-antitoxin module